MQRYLGRVLRVGVGDAGQGEQGRQGRIKKLGLRERKLLFSATNLPFSGFLVCFFFK